MRTGTIHEIKRELQELGKPELVELCLKLAKYKTENKALLDYLLFSSHDKQAFVETVKVEIDALFTELNIQNNLYFAKKGIRKILRVTARYCRYLDNKPMEIDLLLHFCRTLRDTGIPLQKNEVIHNMYLNQVRKIRKLVEGLHEDLQADYASALEALE